MAPKPSRCEYALTASGRRIKLTATTERRNTCTYCSVGCGILIHSLSSRAKNPRSERLLSDPKDAKGHNMADTSLCCTPLVNLWGAYWPAWVMCLVCGVILTLVSRFAFSWTGLEPNLGPLFVVYPMLIVAYACGLWLLLYRV